VNGAQTLSQKPILRLEEHVSRNVTDVLWLSAGAYYNLAEKRASTASTRTIWRTR
jgi:hypothetical protein